MLECAQEVRTVQDLTAYVHRTLCRKENLLADQFPLQTVRLRRGDQECGLQFTLSGPRSIRLGAIWDNERNAIYFYDASGARYLKATLPNRLDLVEAA